MENAKLFCGIPAPGTNDFAALVAMCEEFRVKILSEAPFVFSEIAGVAGFAVALSFVREHGGSEVYLNKKLDLFAERHGLEKSDAEAVMTALLRHRNCKEFFADLPSAWGVFNIIRRVVLEAAIENGASRAKVARAFGVTVRGIRLRKNPGNPRLVASQASPRSPTATKELPPPKSP